MNQRRLRKPLSKPVKPADSTRHGRERAIIERENAPLHRGQRSSMMVDAHAANNSQGNRMRAARVLVDRTAQTTWLHEWISSWKPSCFKSGGARLRESNEPSGHHPVVRRTQFHEHQSLQPSQSLLWSPVLHRFLVKFVPFEIVGATLEHTLLTPLLQYTYSSKRENIKGTVGELPMLFTSRSTAPPQRISECSP